MLEWHSATSCNVVTKEAINLARQAGRAVNAPQRVFMQQCVLVFSKTSTMKLWGLLTKLPYVVLLNAYFSNKRLCPLTQSSIQVHHFSEPVLHQCVKGAVHTVTWKHPFFLTVCPLTTGDMVAGIELLHAVLGYLISIAGITPQIWLGLLKEMRLERARTWTCDCSLGKATVWIGNGSLAW